MAAFSIIPATADRWDDFVTLFGPSGACYGCWCLHFRVPPKVREHTPAAQKREMMHERFLAGPPPGLIGYRGETPVAWMQIGPRADVPEWNNRGRVTTPLDDAPADDVTVWAISCFFFKSSERGKGMSLAMVKAGIAYAGEGGARVLEACPMDKAKQAKSVGLFVGSTSTFVKTGFREVALRKAGRPLMRYDLA